MPRLDDPKTKLKTVKAFERASVRPWDDAEKFKPALKIAENHQENLNINITKDEVATKSNPIGKQKENELVNNWQSKGNSIGNHQETLSYQSEAISKQLILNKKTNSKPNREQLAYKNIIAKEDFYEIVSRIKTLVGLQKILLCFITENCRSRGLLYTDKITNELLRELLKTDAHSVKTTVQRLIMKGLITRKEGKRGKGGFTIFEIHEITRNAVIDEQRQINISQQFGSRQELSNINQIVNNLETNKETFPLSSSSIYNNKLLTTDEVENIVVNIELLEHIGLTYSHISQLIKQQKLTSEQIQDSIYYFAFDLKYNGKQNSIKGDALNFFMGILSRGRPYSKPSNYESPEDEALRKYVETKEKDQNIRMALEEKFKEISTREWLENLSEHELMEFYVPDQVKLDGIPAKLQNTLRKRNATSNAQLYFDLEIWPEKRNELLNSEDFKNVKLVSENNE